MATEGDRNMYEVYKSYNATNSYIFIRTNWFYFYRQASSICKNSLLLKRKYLFLQWWDYDLKRTIGAENARDGGTQTKYHWVAQWSDTSSLKRVVIFRFHTRQELTGLCRRKVTTSPTSSSGRPDRVQYILLSHPVHITKQRLE